MSVIHVNSTNYDEVVTNSEKPVLLDFWASWCGPCRMVAPIVDEVAAEHPEYVIGKVNVDEEPALAKKFGITNIPTLIVLKKGIVTNKAVGVRPKEKILELFGE